MRFLTAVFGVLLIAACTGDPAVDDPDGGVPVAEPEVGVNVEGAADEKPAVDVTDASPPTDLVHQDLVVGNGAEAAPGATVTTHYVGVSWSSGEQFDASWDRGEPITFSLAQVIPGWQQGIPGMQVGGRRLLVIPPGLAYGDQPPPGSAIEPGETLVFVVDLLAVED
jgi:peptidylprolyl isomerase